ncbi:MAG TPA: YopX family protein [Clostridiaceae bacterium]|nr:YopX family protein [Clostridiaceae bacterium]
MNREIKFRGLSFDKGWIYGNLIKSDQNTWIRESDYYNFKVKAETVGQFTGLHDKNGKEIYEGDIVQWADFKMEVFWGEDVGIGYGFCWRNVKGKNEYCESMTGFIDEYEVIGNIYNNPELLGGE